MLAINVRVLGEDQYSRMFSTLAVEAEDLSEPLDPVGDLIIRKVGEQFLMEGAHSGRPWAPLSDSYRRWKEDHFPGRPLLVRTGQMGAIC